MAQLPRNSSMAPVHWGGEDSFAQGHWESSEQSRIPEREGFFEELESCHRPPGVGGWGMKAQLHCCTGCVLSSETLPLTCPGPRRAMGPKQYGKRNSVSMP